LAIRVTVAAGGWGSLAPAPPAGSLQPAKSASAGVSARPRWQLWGFFRPGHPAATPAGQPRLLPDRSHL